MACLKSCLRGIVSSVQRVHQMKRSGTYLVRFASGLKSSSACRFAIPCSVCVASWRVGMYVPQVRVAAPVLAGAPKGVWRLALVGKKRSRVERPPFQVKKIHKCECVFFCCLRPSQRVVNALLK